MATRFGFPALVLVSGAALGAITGALGCGENMLTGALAPVPPVHRAPPDTDGAVVLVAEDAAIETRDPVHVARAKERRIPEDLRASMVRALELAGLRVVTTREQPHDLAASLALVVDESSGKVRQVYRCALRAPDGTAVAQIDWAWPDGVYVDTFDVLDFATHHLANEVVGSRSVLAHLRARRAGKDGGAPTPAP